MCALLVYFIVCDINLSVRSQHDLPSLYLNTKCADGYQNSDINFLPGITICFQFSVYLSEYIIINTLIKVVNSAFTEIITHIGTVLLFASLQKKEIL